MQIFCLNRLYGSILVPQTAGRAEIDNVLRVGNSRVTMYSSRPLPRLSAVLQDADGILANASSSSCRSRLALITTMSEEFDMLRLTTSYKPALTCSTTWMNRRAALYRIVFSNIRNSKFESMLCQIAWMEDCGRDSCAAVVVLSFRVSARGIRVRTG